MLSMGCSDWLLAKLRSKKNTKLARDLRVGSRLKNLRYEQFEDRRMLAVFTVSNLNDSGPGSLRDAVAQANTFFSPDEIKFSVTGTIALTSGQIQVSDTLTISGPGQDALTIDAQQNSRLFLSSAPQFTLSGLTLTGGRTTGTASTNRGGAIRTVSSGALTINDSTIIGNSTLGSSARGGALHAVGVIELNNTTVTNNKTAGAFAWGGAIASNSNVVLNKSIVTGNSTAGDEADGGAIHSEQNVQVTDSMISGNFTDGDEAPGGAIAALGDINLLQTTISGNYTNGPLSQGGGLYSTGNIIVTRSTISDNHTEANMSHGGGLFVINDVDLIESTLSDNYTRGTEAKGGGMYVDDFTTILRSHITGNYTIGDNSYGGAIFAEEETTITASTLVGNHTDGFRGTGGAIHVSGAHLTIDQSTIQGNYTKGITGIGGAIRTASATITASSLVENRTEGSDSNGGAIFANGVLMLENSTVSGNWTEGFDAKGGALIGSGGITLNQSTISGNFTLGDFASGGGIFSNGISVLHSTVTDNHTHHPNVYGGGIANNIGNITITNSILAGNTSQTTSPDLAPGTGIVMVNYSLIGDTTGSGITMASGTGNKLNQPAMLGPLTDNGGPTLTHGPLPGSPVIDMGDPAFVAPPAVDQRGMPFDRIVGGRIDIGAVEDQPIPASADFDNDGDVDGRDFFHWQRGFGTPFPTAVKQDGDADSDYDVDGDDLTVWQLQYDTVPPLVAVESGELRVASSEFSAELVDLALALEWMERDDFGKEVFEQEQLFEIVSARDAAFAVGVNLIPAKTRAATDLRQRASSGSAFDTVEELNSEETTWGTDDSLERMLG